MKTKLLILSTLVYTLGMLSVPAMAQTPLASTASIEEETATHKALSFLAERFNKVGLNALITGMQGAQRERKMLAAFSADGAVLYNEELPAKEELDSEGNVIERLPQFDRTQGIQLMPYTVSILSNGRAFVSAGLMGFRNQDPRAPMMAGPGGTGAIRSLMQIPQLLSTADVLVFEWDSRFSYDNLMTRKIKLGQATFAIPLAKNYARTRVLALTAGGDVSLTQAQLRTDDGRTVMIGKNGSNAGTGFAFNPGAHVGLQYDKYSRSRGGSHFQATAQVKGNWLRGSFRDDQSPAYLENLRTYEVDKAQFDRDQRAWMIQHGFDPCSNCNIDPCYTNLTGIEAPVKPEVPTERIKGTSVVVSTSVTYERPLNPRTGKGKMGHPVAPDNRMIGVTASANIPLRADFKGGTIMQNQMQHLNNVVSAGVFLRF